MSYETMSDEQIIHQIAASINKKKIKSSALAVKGEDIFFKAG